MTTTLDIDLGYEPRAWQAECHRKRRERPPHFEGEWTGFVPIHLIVVHRRGGKSTFAVMELVDSALEDTSGRGCYAYIAPQLNQAKRTIWDTLKGIVKQIPGAEVKEADLYVRLPNGSRIYVFGADNPDALRGLGLDGAILDEYARMHKDTWEAVVQVALMDRKGWAIFISTVAGVDNFSLMFHAASKDTTGRMLVGNYDAYATGVFSEFELEDKKRGMSEMHFRREFLNDFTAAASDQLIAPDLVLEAFGRAPREDSWSFAAKIMALDVAFAESGDRAVIWRRQGLMNFQPWWERGIDNMALAQEAMRQIVEWQPDAIFVDRGRGEGVIARLQQLGANPIGVDFGGRPADPRFRNKKAEMAFAVKEHLLEGGALPTNPDIRTDFCGVHVKQSDATGKLEIVYDENLPSPDLLAGCMLTFAQPVLPPARNRHDYETRRYGLKPGKAKTGRSDDFYRV